MRHVVQWTAPAPLWAPAPQREGSAETDRFRRPAILRFASDSFMEDILATLATDPSRVAELEARYETWREPSPAFPGLAAALGATATVGSAQGAPVAGPTNSRERMLTRLRVAGERRLERARRMVNGSGRAAPADGRLLKLYQPAHQRYYLVSACLVCRLPGLPDRALSVERRDRAAFVVRRLRTVTDGSTRTTEEYAFLDGPNGGWLRVAAAELLQPGEERLPLFPLNFDDDTGYRRRLLAGLVPVGRREGYMGAPIVSSAAVAPDAAAGAALAASGDAADPGAPAPPVDPRTALFVGQVSEPWKALLAKARKDAEALAASAAYDAAKKETNDRSRMEKESRENVQIGSWYVLLDFAAFLQRYLPNVWNVLGGTAAPANAAEQALVAALVGTTVSTSLSASLLSAIPPAQRPSVATSLPAALAAAAVAEAGLERVVGGYDRSAPAADWPSFLFPLADAVEAPPIPPVTLAAPAPNAHSDRLRRVSRLVALVTAALPATSDVPVPPTPLAAKSPMAPGERATFVIRCVYERPECGPFDPTVVSEPTEPFEIAGFFDPDAPARPIRISLPVDTTPAGLRKFDRNTAFVMSDVLCGQVARAKGLGFVDLVLSVLPWPFYKPLSVADPGGCKTESGLQLGMICSLSIPIITICALILLIVIVALLDLIFKWLPFFIFCFPLPGFKAKEERA